MKTGSRVIFNHKWSHISYVNLIKSRRRGLGQIKARRRECEQRDEVCKAITALLILLLVLSLVIGSSSHISRSP